jgi:elongation factor Ts
LIVDNGRPGTLARRLEIELYFLESHMSTISAAAVKSLRDRTNAPMMDCKAALTEANGDMDKAVEILRKKNAAIQAKKGDRETAEGRIGIYIDPAKQVGAIVEMRCESAPVAKSEQFVQLAQGIAKQVAVKGAQTVDALLAQPSVDDPKKTVNERIGEVIGLIRENMRPARLTRLEGQLGSYAHHDGSVGVLLQVEGPKADPQLLRDICMHITAKNPVSARREDVSPAVIEKEKEIAKTQAAATGKPANIVDKIAEGKMKTWFAESVLLEQPFVKDDSKTVGDLLKSAGLKLVGYVRYKVGEISP